VIGWRGMLWIGILPAFAVIYVRYFVNEPAVWLENRRKQREAKREVHAPLLSIFKRELLGNTLTACWWMASAFVVYYSIYALFATYLQKDLNLSPALVATPLALGNLAAFFAQGFWGWVADKIGRRWSIIIPALIGCLVTPIYLLTTDIFWIQAGFVLQGFFGGAIYGQNPSYLTERFPTEVRATASAFCYHQGAIFGGLVAPIITYFAASHNTGFAIPMLIGTAVGSISVVIALLLSPETKGKVFVSDLVVV
jgi:SHS family lactate transporter-like MFS transporter